jgi:SNF2 family DNA or RNA helicase
MTFKGSLLPYQPEAVERMCDRQKVLVAYDLGLGKTVLTIAALEKLMDEGKITEPGIIVCLSSLKYQWANQIKKFTENSSVPLVIDGTPKQREEQYNRAYRWKQNKIDYVILNYEQVVNDWKLVQKLPRGFVVLDEATAIKSFRSKRSKAVKRLANAPYRFALTGTPIENGKPEELFSIMQFVDDTVLGRFDIFDKAFIVRNQWGGVMRYRNLDTLHTRLKEACVRKSQKDSDVAPYLPDAIYKEPIQVVLDRKTAKVYERIVTDLKTDLDTAQTLFGSSFNILAHYGYERDFGQGDELRGKIMSKVGCLKMLCCSPELVRISASKFLLANGEGSSYANELVQAGLLDGLPNTKLDVLIDYVKDFLEQSESNKIVIFCTYVDLLDMISERLGPDMCRVYSGRIDAKTKEENKVAFNTDPSIRVLISSDAGGYGVDLPAANQLVNFDLPWSSGLAVQRNGRINRASSEWATIVIQEILVSGSIEMRQHEALEQKNAVASAVIDGTGINAKGGVDLTIGSLSQFLRSASV